MGPVGSAGTNRSLWAANLFGNAWQAGSAGTAKFGRSMRNFGRILTLGVLGLVGCEDKNFNLLPTDATGPLTAAGTGGEVATSGMAGSGGTGGRAGTGGSGNGGNAGTKSNAGSGGAAQCGTPDNPPRCYVLGCDPCCSDDDCHDAEKPYCSHYSGCVACRTASDCVDGHDCPSDCDPGLTCDYATNTCLPSCGYCPQTSRPFCDLNRMVCVECRSNADCHGIQHCSPAGECGECFNRTDPCPPDRPICHPEALDCEACTSDDECALLPGGSHELCKGGKCVMSSQSP
jgi:hypothetical protein